jgi:uncharacterized membrane protein
MMEHEITPEKKRQLDKLGMAFMIKSMWSGVTHAIMAILMNVILVMGVEVFFDGNKTIGVIGSIAIGIFVFRRMLSVFASDFKKLSEAAKKIIKN